MVRVTGGPISDCILLCTAHESPIQTNLPLCHFQGRSPKHLRNNTERMGPAHASLQILDKGRLAAAGMEHQIKREIHILKHLHHPNIVDLKEVMASRESVFMVMELVPGGELFDQILVEGAMKVGTYVFTIVMPYMHVKQESSSQLH